MPASPEPRWWRLVATCALLLGVMVRAWPWLVEPLLAWEDGALFFAANYSEFRPEQCVMPYQGYVPFGSNVLAIILCRLPTACIANSFSVAAVVIYACSAGAILRPAWQSVAPFAQRLLLAATVAWLPFGSHLEFTTLAYAQWPMLWWLFVLLLEPGKNRERGYLHAALVLLLTLSHPLAATLTPLVLLPGCWRSQRLRWACFLGAVCGYWLVAMMVVTDRAQLAPLHLVEQFGPMMATRVALEAVVGGGGREKLQGVAPWLGWVLGAGTWLMFCAGVAVVWRQWPLATRRLTVALVWMAVVTVAASLLGRPQLGGQDPWIVRYVWLARAAFLIVLQLTISRLVGWRWCVLVTALLAIVLGVSNRAWHHHPGHSGRLRGFVEELRKQERERGGRRWIRTSMQPDAGPRIVIRPF